MFIRLQLSFLILLLLAPSPLLAATPSPQQASLSIKVHDTTIILPDLDGFDSDIMKNPVMADMAIKFFPSNEEEKTYWVYITTDIMKQFLGPDPRKIETNAGVQVSYRLIGEQLTPFEFGMSKSTIQNQASNLQVAYSDKSKLQFYDAINDFVNQTQKTLTVGNMVTEPLGVVSDEALYRTIAVLHIGCFTINDKPTYVVEITIRSFILASNKVINFSVHAAFKEGKGFEEALAVNKEFTQKIIENNPSETWFFSREMLQ